jgi:hypothetical protein
MPDDNSDPTADALIDFIIACDPLGVFADLIDFHTNHPEGYGIGIEPAQPVDSAALDYTYGKHSGHGGYLSRDRASRFIDRSKSKGVGEHREGATCACYPD